MAALQRTSPGPSASARHHPFNTRCPRSRIRSSGDALKEKHLKEALSQIALQLHRCCRRRQAPALEASQRLPAREQNRGENFSHPRTLFASGFAELRKLLGGGRRRVRAGYVHRRPVRRGTMRVDATSMRAHELHVGMPAPSGMSTPATARTRRRPGHPSRTDNARDVGNRTMARAGKKKRPHRAAVFSRQARISDPRLPALRRRRPGPAVRSTRPCWTARSRRSSLHRRRLR